MASRDREDRSSRAQLGVTYADYHFSDQDEPQVSGNSGSSDGGFVPSASEQESTDEDAHDETFCPEAPESDGGPSSQIQRRRIARSSQLQTSVRADGSYELYEYDPSSTDKEKYELDKLRLKSEPSVKPRRLLQAKPTPSTEARTPSKGKQRARSSYNRSRSPAPGFSKGKQPAQGNEKTIYITSSKGIRQNSLRQEQVFAV